MKILGIDTAIPTASVALIENGKIHADTVQGEPSRRCVKHGRVAIGNHAEVLIPLIQSILDRRQLTLHELSAIALSIGPGSFTGLRIGLATAKGLAYGANLPLVGISTLEATAARVSDSDGVIGALLDARKGEVYVALFHRRAGALARVTADALLSSSSTIDLLESYRDRQDPLVLIGTGATVHQEQLRQAFGDAFRISTGAGCASAAAQVATLALPRLAAAALCDDVGSLTPVYLRSSEAEARRKFRHNMLDNYGES